jgi:hypothetical protein
MKRDQNFAIMFLVPYPKLPEGNLERQQQENYLCLCWWWDEERE